MPHSPASSSSSFHSSHASPPPSPQAQPQPQLFPPPDPSLPPPDISPEYIPPSALNASHKSLLNLQQPIASLSERAEYADSSRGPFQPVQSRAHSLIGGGRGKDSVYSFRHRQQQPQPQQPPTPSALGFVPDQTGRPMASSSRPYSPQLPAPPIHRDFVAATPDLLSASPYIGLGGSQQYPRAGSTSTFAPAPLNVPYTLQQIQTSLTALHERMSTLERTQAMILRRDERRKGWFWTSREEEELSDGEEQDARARWGETATTTTRRRRRPALGIRAIWFLLGLARRAAVDVTVGMLIALAAAVIMGGGLRRFRVTIQSWRARFQRLLTDAA